ncbi:MAG: hypothetical protein QG567_2493 [Campylobacterota bacterium]|nr:hypothetical protein [Campylobacterota bacterium]
MSNTSFAMANLLYGGTTYAEGAPKTTLGKPLYDGNIDKIDSTSASKIRKQTHWLNVNTTDVPTMIQSATAKTIGISINTQVESKNEIFNREAEELIEEHDRLGIGELTNKYHFNAAMRAISNFDLLDGGIIVRHHYNTAWAIPYKYELVGVDMIDTSKFTSYNSKEPLTIAGLVFNKWNQITHIYIYDTEDKRSSTKVPYENITYYSEVWVSIGQQVAISKLASILPTLDKIDQYGKAELEAAIEEAKAGAYVRSTAYNEIMRIAFDKINGLNDFDKQVTEIKTILQQLSRVGIGNYGLSPIPSGDEVVFNNSKRDSIYGDLNDNSEMKMSSAIGMSSLGVYSKADKVNYSAMKYVSETDQLSASIRFDNISNIIIDDIRARLIQVGVQIGRITTRMAYWKNPASFHKFRYLRRIKIDIEPAKTALANKTNLELGLTDEAEIIETSKGVKYETFIKKANEKALFKFKEQVELEKKKQAILKASGITLDVEVIEPQKSKPEQDDALLHMILNEEKE